MQTHLIVHLALRISALTPGFKTLAGFLRIFFVNEKSALGNELVSAEARAKASGSINNFPAVSMKTRHGEGHQDCLAATMYSTFVFLPVALFMN